MRTSGAVALLVSLGCAAPAAAQEVPYELPLRVSVAAPGDVLTGEHVRISGKVRPRATGRHVTIAARRGGATVLMKRVTVDNSGRFRLGTRFRRAGRLTIVARVLASASKPIHVVVRGLGHRRPGCGFAPHVVGGGVLPRGVLLATDARIRVPDGRRFRIAEGATRFVAAAGVYVVDCRGLRIERGRVVASGRARLIAPPAMALLRGPGKLIASPERFGYVRGTGYVASSLAPTSRVQAIDGDRVLLTPDGLLRMDTWPFARSPEERPARPSDRLPALWADGQSCSVGCRPAGARTGWPLKPFHEQHALRAGLNEWRPANMHFGVDIEANNGQAVHAIQAGTADSGSRGTTDVHVDVGNYEYWHVTPSVPDGSYVRAGEVVGHILDPGGHLHLAETRAGEYLNPLRPGGRVLEPWSDHEPPVIGRPHRAGATVFSDVFDPQSLRITTGGHRTPVLAPAAVAWRARDASGHAISSLRFAYRGSQHYPDSAKRLVYGPGTHEPSSAFGALGGGCFRRALVCIPRSNYRLIGVPAEAAALTVYAWDWDGNRSVLTSRL